MTIVVPVYQEKPHILRQAIESWLANHVDEVILVIDETDIVSQEIAGRYQVRVVTTGVPGKREAMRLGWRSARTELLAPVDSDTIWAPDVALEVVKPFADPRIGRVGTRRNACERSGFLGRANDMFLDQRYFDENACQSRMGRAVSCLSGRTAVYRRALLLEIEQEFLNGTFWGVRCLSGDDKRLTTPPLEHGHLTYMQRTARVWSTLPTRWPGFLARRLRWARNTWRSDLRALSRRYPFLAYTVLDKGVSCFTLLVGPAFLGYALVNHRWVFVAVLLAWCQISRSVQLLPHLTQRPSSLCYIPGYVLVSWIMALVKIWALLTIRTQRWSTRHVAVHQGHVIRIGPTSDGFAS